MNALPSIFPWLLDSSLAVTLLLALSQLARRFLHQPAMRQRLGECTLIACLLVAALSALPTWPKMSLHLLPAPVSAPMSGPVTDSSATPPAIDAGLIRTSTSATQASPASPIKPPAPISPWRFLLAHTRLYLACLPALYLFGVLLVAARLLLGHLILHQLVRRSVSPSPQVHALFSDLSASTRPVRLLVSSHCSRPFAAGLLTPIIVIPHSLCRPESREPLRAILLHELTHIRRHDALTWFLAALVQLLFYYHPLYWLLRRDLRRAQESLADSTAASQLGSPADYAQHLLDLLAADPTPRLRLLPVLAALRRPSEFYQRMEQLLLNQDQTPPRPRASRIFSLAALLAMTLLAVAAGTLTVRATPANQSLQTSPTYSVLARDSELRGLSYLLASQDPSGAWLPRTGPGVTALAVKTLLQAGYPETHPAVARALAFIDSTRQSDHGYYTDSAPAYNTAIVISTLALLPSHRYQSQIAAARTFLAEFQVTQNKPSTNPFYAGAKPRQNIYDSATILEALHDTTIDTGGGDHLLHASLKSVIATGYSLDPADRADDTLLGNYGSITYACLKSMLYAGLAPNDPRVTSLLGCIQSHYTLDYSPNDSSARGLFYYYHTFAKTLHAYHHDSITDSHGTTHLWRSELITRLTSLQRPDGSWINPRSDAYLESDPILVTTYSLLALQETH